MHVDRRLFLATLGVGSLKIMSSEEKADALEHYMIEQLDGGAEDSDLQQGRNRQQDGRWTPRGIGGLFRPRRQGQEFEPMPDKPTLHDFFRLRFAPANHVLQSATHAMKNDQPEQTILACLLHDTVLNLIKPDHGDWGAQLYGPYVAEEISWGIKFHAPLRFYADESVGYEYPEMYNRMFGEDYVPSEITAKKHEFARNHKWYMHARRVTLNDKYAFERGVQVSIDPFEDIIGRHFKQPKEGLGNDDGASAHMWRTIANPNRPL